MFSTGLGFYIFGITALTAVFSLILKAGFELSPFVDTLKNTASLTNNHISIQKAMGHEIVTLQEINEKNAINSSENKFTTLASKIFLSHAKTDYIVVNSYGVRLCLFPASPAKGRYSISRPLKPTGYL